MELHEKNLKTLREELEQTRKNALSATLLNREYENMKSLSNNYRLMLDDISDARKRILCQQLVKRIVLYRSQVGTSRDITGTITFTFEHQTKLGLAFEVCTDEAHGNG